MKLFDSMRAAVLIHLDMAAAVALTGLVLLAPSTSASETRGGADADVDAAVTSKTQTPAMDTPAMETPSLDATALPSAEAFDLFALEPGQRGYGLSVFAGSEPERFEVEVLGVWRNSTPDLSYVLARLSGQGLEHSGVAAGMSGSPVYIDGKLVGAVSFSFSFGLDPIAGITPIEPMRRLGDASGGLLRFEPPALEPAAGVASAPRGAPELAPRLATILRHEVDPELLTRHLELLRPAAALGGGASPLGWTASGFGAPAADLLQNTLGTGLRAAPSPLAALAPAPAPTGPVRAARSVAEAGSASRITESDGELEPGDAVALVLVRGDLTLAAHGTVTDRSDDSIVAFGHPVYSLGPTRLPMAASQVIAVVPSASSSFKLSNVGPLLGVFDQDREAGAHGVLGVEPAMVPVSVRLDGLTEREYAMEVADSSIFRPSLIAVSALGALTSGSYVTGFQGIDVEARFQLAARDDLVLRQSFDGSDAATEAVVFLLQIGAFLDLNPLGNATIEAVDVRFHQVAEPRTMTLARAFPARDRVAPGDTLDVVLEIDPYRGPTERRRLQVAIPDNVPDGRYWLMIGDGASMDGVRQSVEKRELTTFDQSLEALRALSSRRQLEVVGLVGAQGLSLGGEVLPDLPGSLRSVYAGAAGPGAAAPLNLRILGESVEELDRPLEGMLRLDLEVRRDG
ncbi:MAG: hypothetical protein AAGC60_23900 [Acidobacteriota bacterium]